LVGVRFLRRDLAGHDPSAFGRRISDLVSLADPKFHVRMHVAEFVQDETVGC